MNTKIYINNQNKWIAADKKYKKVLFANKNLDQLQKSIKKSKIKDAVIMFVPPFNSTLAPDSLLGREGFFNYFDYIKFNTKRRFLEIKY